MINTVYAPQLVKAIIEETRLNADPGSNRPLYDLLRYGRKVLSHPQPESISPTKIASIEDSLATYSQSYAAAHYRERLLEFEAERIISARDVFELERVARLVRDLGGYRTPQALNARQELDNLGRMVQEARGYAQGVKFLEPRAHQVLEVLAPYAHLSKEVSGVHKLLAEHLGLQNLFSGFPEVRTEEDQPRL